jgi:hypothetical protein
VTAREQLHRIIDFLDERQIAAALGVLEPLADTGLDFGLHAAAVPESTGWSTHDLGDLAELTVPARCAGRHRRW